MPQARTPELIHFYMGIFWKASAHPQRKGTADPWINLGTYSELTRKFLRGEAPFPEKVALSISVLPPPVTLIAFHPPYETIGLDPSFQLYVSGFNCTLCVGNNIPPELALSSVHRSPHHLLVVDNAADIAKKFRESYAWASDRKGKTHPGASGSELEHRLRIAMRACNKNITLWKGRFASSGKLVTANESVSRPRQRK